jgi:hypothetical protein
MLSATIADLITYIFAFFRVVGDVAEKCVSFLSAYANLLVEMLWNDMA